jgi:hypothetical protein
MTETEDMVVDVKPRDASAGETPRGAAGASGGRRDPAAKSAAVSSPDTLALEIRSTTILKVLGYFMLAIIAMHFMVMVSWFGFGYIVLKGFVALFNLEAEKNIPTLFSSLQLCLAAALLGICAARAKLSDAPYFKHWVGLALIFVFLAFDESALIHEKTMSVSRALFGGDGLFYYTWIIPFGGLALAVLATYSRFLLALPRRSGVIFLLSGAVFVTGALGLEMFEGQINQAGGYRSLDYMILVTIEEILEMAGIFAFIYGLLGYLLVEGRPVRMSLVR